MRKLLVIFVSLLVLPIAFGADGVVPITPGPIGPGNDAPEVFLAMRMFDLGIDIDGSGSTINPYNIRNANYAFTGERIIWYVLVRDSNGAEDINMVRWVKMVNGSPEVQMGPCDLFPEIFYSPELVAELTNLLYDDQLDKVFMCELTVESQWGGDDPAIYIEAEDQGGETGNMIPEYWTFNPPLTVGLNTSDGAGALLFDPVMDDQAPTCVTAPNCVRTINENQQTTIRKTCQSHADNHTSGLSIRVPETDEGTVA